MTDKLKALIKNCITTAKRVEQEVMKDDPSEAVIYMLCCEVIRFATAAIIMAEEQKLPDVIANLEENRKHYVNGLSSWTTLKKNYARKVLTGLVDFVEPK